MNTRTQPPAFVVLFAALATVLMLTIGAGIFSISTKQALLSGGAREAQYAFTAADTGMECALLAQQQGLFTSPSVNQISCADSTVQITPLGNPGEFEMRLQTSPSINGISTCAYVKVQTAAPTRTIVSQGYNLCTNDAPQFGNPRIQERDLATSFSVGGGTSQQGTGGNGNQVQSIPGGGITNNQSTLSIANTSPQVMQLYQALLDQQNANVQPSVPDATGTQKSLDVDPSVTTVDSGCPAGYVRQSATSATTSTRGNIASDNPTGTVQTSSAVQGTLASGYKVNLASDPCVPSTDCPAGTVRQSILTSGGTLTSDTAQVGIGKGTDPCVGVSTRSGTASSQTTLPDAQTNQKTAAGTVIESVVHTVQESFQSVLQLFK